MNLRPATALLILGLAGSAFAGGCSSSSHATGFCAAVKRGEPAFDATRGASKKQALAAFDEVVAKAPAAIAPDLKTVGAYLRLEYVKPSALVNNQAAYDRFAAASARVDHYLNQSCGLRIPPVANGL